MIESLKRNKGRTDFVACAARVIASRLREDARCYLHYEETWGSGNDTFSLDGETDWVLRDPDYEAMTVEHFRDDGF